MDHDYDEMLKCKQVQGEKQVLIQHLKGKREMEICYKGEPQVETSVSGWGKQGGVALRLVHPEHIFLAVVCIFFCVFRHVLVNVNELEDLGKLAPLYRCFI